MLLVPCVLAFQTARSAHEIAASEPAEIRSSSFSLYREPAVYQTAMTNAELTAKRNRELYLRGLAR